MKQVFVIAVGLWAPGFPSPEAWVGQRPDSSVVRPTCKMLRTRIGRYASPLARLAVAAIEQVGERSGADLERIPSVFGSAYGEIRIAFDQLDMIEREGVPSPARFKNSVHNAASGHFSIATRNTCFSTAIAAGHATFAMCLLEAWAWLDVHRGAVLVAIMDESLPDHLTAFGSYEPLGLAFLLAADPPEREALGRLGGLGCRPRRLEPATIPERWVENPCSPGLPLVEALVRKRDGVVPVDRGGGWSVELQAGAGDVA